MKPKSGNEVVMRLFIITLTIILTSFSFAGDLSGKVNCKGVRSNQGAVVYLERVKGDFSPGKTPVIMDQKGLKFNPHVLVIPVGTTVDFVNSDDVLHNVFSPDKCTEKFNLGTWPKGEKRSYTFQNEGCFSVVLCNVHPEMEAWILVLQNTYSAITDKDGAYTISDVPPGKYNVIAWHERLKNKNQEIVISEAEITTLNFNLSRR